MRPRRWAVAAVCAATVGTAACSGGSRAAAPRDGGTLRVGVVGLLSLDPAQADLPAEATAAEMLFEPLVRLGARTPRPRPGLASRWRVNPAQTVFTFTIRRDARFQDGTRVTAADVKATLDRVAAKRTMSPLASLLDAVAGYRETHDAGSAPGLSGVLTKGPRTVEITLSRPFALLPVVLAHPGLGILPAADAGSVEDHPVGAGPFRFVGRDGGVVRLARARRAPGAVAPHVSRVELVPFAKQADAQAAFDAGKLDVLREVNEAAPLLSRRHQERVAPYLAVGFYALNLKSLQFLDARFRQAVIRALDARTLVRKGYARRAAVASGIVPSGVPGGPSDACRATCDHDVGAAKRLLAQEFPNGGVFSIAVDFDESPTQEALADEVVAELAAVGIPATKRLHAADAYGSFLANDVPELFRLGWVGDFPSAAAFLDPLFVSGAAENIAHVASPAADAAIKAAEGEASPVKRAARFAQAERAILDTFVVAPVVQFETRLALARRVHGLAIDPFGGFAPAAVWVAGHG